MDKTLWQAETTIQLTDNFKENEDIIAFSIFGSTSSTENKFDFWSDIDGLLVVEDESFKKFSDNLKWIEFIGTIFTYQYQPGEHSQTYRLIFEDFKKLDLVVVKESKIDIVAQSYTGPYWKEINVLFSKSGEIAQKLKTTKKEITLTSFTEQQFMDLVNNFWFVASLSLYKVMRNDLLIAQHLALDLYKDCLSLGMILRDRETGSNIHKTGGVGNDIAKNLDIPLERITQLNVLNLIDNCGREFDQLCIKWSKGFLSKHKTLHPYIQKAKSEIEH